MGMGAAHKAGVERTGKPYVINKVSPAGQERGVLFAFDGSTEKFRAIVPMRSGGIVLFNRHQAFSSRGLVSPPGANSIYASGME
jgi:hypothetical protein